MLETINKIRSLRAELEELEGTIWDSITAKHHVKEGVEDVIQSILENIEDFESECVVAVITEILNGCQQRSAKKKRHHHGSSQNLQPTN